jgi:hypothetical protein
LLPQLLFQRADLVADRAVRDEQFGGGSRKLSWRAAASKVRSAASAGRRGNSRFQLRGSSGFQAPVQTMVLSAM